MINGPGMMNGPEAMQLAVAEKRTQVSGDWFFWIAGLSLLSSVLTLTGTSYHSLFGLGTTQVIDARAISIGKGVAIAFDLLAISFYVLYGFFARRGAVWAFVAGAVFYLLDVVLLVVFQVWLPVVFHAWALFRIFQGFQAARQLKILRSSAYTGYAPQVSPPSDVWPPPPSV